MVAIQAEGNLKEEQGIKRVVNMTVTLPVGGVVLA
ncbi:MAG: hypothetical protein QOC89_618 [Paraburkholderia sp.]|jgi:hypothetical protein|nr:hypothetical protein [Paraburkholderia sp.]MEA3130507.1 hypothetical protein [Paraburkholderia sp.]